MAAAMLRRRIGRAAGAKVARGGQGVFAGLVYGGARDYPDGARPRRTVCGKGEAG
jgi:hypothetical protein